MGYKAEILADSVSDAAGHRLTTFLLSYPRMIHAELMTHSMLARNGESSRARPVIKNIEEVELEPFVPEVFGKNKPGMQFDEALQGQAAVESEWTWREAAWDAVKRARDLDELGVHKSYANRVLEPYKFYTAIFTGTDWSNFFALRTHLDAQPEFRKLALMMREQYDSQEPTPLSAGAWHVPFVGLDEIGDHGLVDWPMWCRISAARCARISYLTHDGRRDLKADLVLSSMLQANGHMSPFAHQARPFEYSEWEAIRQAQDAIPVTTQRDFRVRMARNLEYCAQFHGWWQHRADIPYESDFSQRPA